MAETQYVNKNGIRVFRTPQRKPRIPGTRRPKTVVRCDERVRRMTEAIARGASMKEIMFFKYRLGVPLFARTLRRAGIDPKQFFAQPVNPFRRR